MAVRRALLMLFARAIPPFRPSSTAAWLFPPPSATRLLPRDRTAWLEPRSSPWRPRACGRLRVFGILLTAKHRTHPMVLVPMANHQETPTDFESHAEILVAHQLDLVAQLERQLRG